MADNNLSSTVVSPLVFNSLLLLEDLDLSNNNQIIAGIKENGIQKIYWSGNNSGTITITRFDYFNGIYSGIFSFTLYNNDNPTETINITDGRFDINVATLNQ